MVRPVNSYRNQPVIKHKASKMLLRKSLLWEWEEGINSKKSSQHLLRTFNGPDTVILHVCNSTGHHNDIMK